MFYLETKFHGVPMLAVACGAFQKCVKTRCSLEVVNFVKIWQKVVLFDKLAS